jgi:hypothetical protein
LYRLKFYVLEYNLKVEDRDGIQPQYEYLKVAPALNQTLCKFLSMGPDIAPIARTVWYEMKQFVLGVQYSNC